MAEIKYPWTKPVYMGKEKKYLLDALSSTWISGGAYVQKFEKEFGEFIKAPYAHNIQWDNGPVFSDAGPGDRSRG
jgi:dTDP-4-amino-4,6-dideoxygalactose transaminase